MQTVRVLENTLVGSQLHHIVLDTAGTALDEAFTVPGQYVQLTVGEAQPAYMAIASAPGAGHFEFLIQSTEGTAGDLCAIQAGGAVLISLPMGKGFNMQTIGANTPLFFVTGTGISAIRSIIESRDWQGTGARLYYGTFTPADMVGLNRIGAPAVSPDGKWLVIINGAYGERILKILERHDITAEAIRCPENESTDKVAIESALTNGSLTHVAIVHCETTSGIMNPIAEIGAVAKRHGCIYFIDSNFS